jgi:fumarylacetoacetate (FAA) hydrolase family protein
MKLIGEDMIQITTRDSLPVDAADSVLAGRVWRPEVNGPSIVTLRRSPVTSIIDSITILHATMF